MSCNITYKPLEIKHLPILLEWLNQPHVKEWWDHDVLWTPSLVKEKYGSYIQDYKQGDGYKQKMSAFVICLNEREIGYCQYYNVNDFMEDERKELESIQESLAGLDLFLGEHDIIGKGWGSQIINNFCKNYIDHHFEACFVDPNNNNVRAIRAFEKAGFIKFNSATNKASTWMLREKNK